MEFEINNDSDVHGYRQLADQLAQKIASGEIVTRLPSLAELCDASGLSMSSVQHAIKVLKDEGLVYSVKGRGTFVRRG